MASMVKERRKGTKKIKQEFKSSYVDEGSPSNDFAREDSIEPQVKIENVTEKPTEPEVLEPEVLTQHDCQEPQLLASMEQHISINEDVESKTAPPDEVLTEEAIKNPPAEDMPQQSGQLNFKSLNAELERMSALDHGMQVDQATLSDLEHNANSQPIKKEMLEEYQASSGITMQDATAPIFIEHTVQQYKIKEEVFLPIKVKVECMPLDEAIRLFCGTEIAAMKEISEKEEALVEAGPNANPDHPLVDLLATFRSSIRAMECERIKLVKNLDDEEKYRETLWKVEKQKLQLTQPCKCGVDVVLKASYEEATLLKEKLPIAKIKLESILRDVQESYCHHQHAALLAHCQIGDLVSEIAKGSKGEIRVALSLVLAALRLCEGAGEALPAALQHWAAALAGALVDERDLRQLFFVIHHLFRQTRSVRWASRVLHTRVTDSVTAARTLVVLDVLLSKMHLESAMECEEETEASWEEVDIKGGHGAVGSGTLRERDVIALVRALPLQQLISKLVLFPHADFRQATEYEWGDSSGGNDFLKACSGVRVLLLVLQRAASQHASYQRLQGVLRELACTALVALGCLYQSPRVPYLADLKEKILLELHAAFACAFTLFGTQELHKLPTTLLNEDAARDYCLAFITGLHDKSPKSIQSLSIEAPILPCDVRVRITTQASVHRENDHELAITVLDFLLQTSLKRKKVPCKAGCEPTARDCVPLLLTAHPYMYGLALHTLADISQVETLEPSRVSVLHVNKWRPNLEEMQAVIDDWSQRCPALLHQLLLQLDYTPHTGVSLPVQLLIGKYICSGQVQSEQAWGVLIRLRAHRACWGVPYEAPPPAAIPLDLLNMAHAVLTTDWGHSLPQICTNGVQAILMLCATRPREAVHCLAPIMLLMPQSPESISLTPKFAELFTILLSCGPNLVQRALGRGGASGSELLLRLVLSQVDMKQPYVFTAWLHALWKVPAALSILDIAALAVRDWYTMDVYASTLMQEGNAKECLTNAVRFAFTSPLLCECLLRAAHLLEVNSQLFPTLVIALNKQRAASQKIHVDNALQKICPFMHSEELIIYRCANAALVSPFQHPSHLTLWRLFFHIYLQKAENQPTSVPCGPLFYNGIIKSRALAHIKKRLSETIAYHHTEVELYKAQPTTSNQPSNVLANQHIVQNSLLPALTINDLTEESVEYDDSDSEESCQNATLDGSTEEAIELEKKRNANMAAYHQGAEKMVREFLRWLEEGESVKAAPQNADISWFILPQALEEAWNTTLSRCRPPPSPELDTFPRPEAAPAYNTDVPLSPLQIAIETLLTVKCHSPTRSLKRPRIKTEELDTRTVTDIPTLFAIVNELLKDTDTYADTWSTDVARISSLDSRLWELVATLRVPHHLPPVKRQCSNKCQPLTFHLNAQEWCISAGAERGIKENRSAYITGIRRLTRAKTGMARTAASLHTIARRINSEPLAVQVLEMSWRCAAECPPCTAAHAALSALFALLAERWITPNGRLCYKLLSECVSSTASSLQESLCGSLVAPRHTADADWPPIYITVLNSNMPEHTVFSYLSRFELSRWKKYAQKYQRETILKALFTAAQRPIPEDCEGVLLELVGVHTALLSTASDLVWLLDKAASMSAVGNLPPGYWQHLVEATDEHAINMSMSDLSNILHALGTTWLNASRRFSERHATYSQHMAEILTILMREFVTAGMKLTYTQTRICNSAWEVLTVSWRPWIEPRTILPHPATGSQHYTTMLKEFCSCIKQIIDDLPEASGLVLKRTFAWCISTWTSNHVASRVLLTAMLQQLAQLPWHQYQWFSYFAAHDLSKALDMGEEIERWCCERFTATKTNTFLVGLKEENDDLDRYLCFLLEILGANVYVTNAELIDQACMLPWWHLSLEGFDHLLVKFLNTFYNLSKPYKDTLQMKLMLYASEIIPRSRQSKNARRKRMSLVTQLSKAYAQHNMDEHRHTYVEFMLGHITRLYPCLKPALVLSSLKIHDGFGEVPDLLQELAMITLGVRAQKPELSTLTLQAWIKWINEITSKDLHCRVVEMAGQLTNLQCTGFLVDAIVKSYILKCDEWIEFRGLWWFAVAEPVQYAVQCALHAAYGAALHTTREPPSAAAGALIAQLHAITAAGRIDFVKEEVIIAVWICYLARTIRSCQDALAQANTTPGIELTPSAINECMESAISLLATWGQEQSRSFIKMVTFQVETNKPTLRHRVLIRLADCFRSPSDENAAAYETACAGLPTVSADVIAWGKAPSLRKLATLGARLFHLSERYFRYEYKMAPVD